MINPSKIGLTETLAPFFNQSFDCLCIANFEGYFVDINPGFVSLLGYSKEELMSKKISEFIYAEDREPTAQKRQKLLENVPLVNFENRYVSKSGKLVWLHWTSVPLSEQGLVYAIAKDITYTKELQKERLSHLKNLSIANKELKQLNYTTAHDLRSPINNLISLVNLIDLDKVIDSETQEILAMIKVSTISLIDTMNSQIDAFKEIDTTQRQLSKTNLIDVINKVQHSIGSLIKQSDTQFHIDLSALPVVWFNPQALESIFLNLITNSIKYSKSGVPPIITLHSALEDGKHILRYNDNGIGFDLSKTGDQLFKLNQGHHGGSNSKGVGLYLVHQKVTDYGGSIEVDSEVNQGTTFTITFSEDPNSSIPQMCLPEHRTHFLVNLQIMLFQRFLSNLHSGNPLGISGFGVNFLRVIFSKCNDQTYCPNFWGIYDSNLIFGYRTIKFIFHMFPSKNTEKNLFIILYLNAIYPLGPSLKNYLVQHIKSCSFERNQIISRAGEVCNRLYLIKKGMVRGYFVSDEIELTTWVDTENEVFTSITGFFRNEPCQEYMQSLEETYCDYMDYEDYKYCLNNFPEMRHINRILLEEYYILAEKRVYLARIPNAKKRLAYYMEHMKPQIVDRIPRKHLASYLAIRPETLSRLLRERN